MSISRRIFELALPVALAVLPPLACAQSILDFDGWMQKIDRRNQSVQRNLASKDAKAASADAQQIVDLYGSMETYFTRRPQSAEAVKLSKEGRDLATTIIRSLAANDFADASKAALDIAHACRACHLQYKPLS